MSRIHREWFRTVSLGGRKSCPCCGEKLGKRSIWSWGEYVNAKWRTVKHFCSKCYKDEVQSLLIHHRDQCGCEFELVGKGDVLPRWLSLPKKRKRKARAA